MASFERLCFCFPLLICIDKMVFSLCLTLYFPHSLLSFTHAASIHFQYYFCFLPASSPAAALVPQKKLHFHFLSFLLTFCFLFIVNFLFLFFHFAVPPDLPSLPISLALGLLNCAFYLYAALQYSGGGGLFSPYVHFRDRAVPPTISIHLPPTFSCSHDCF